MHLPSIRLASHLNALIHGRLSAEVAAQAIAEPDVAHHVVDPDGRLGLDPLTAHELELVLPQLRLAERDGWALALPVPGRLGGLRGPRELNEAALDAGEVVIGMTAGLALVPLQVGPAVQWRIHEAATPALTSTPYDAERSLNEVILESADTLSALDVAAGIRPRRDTELHLAPGYSSRQLVTAERADRLLQAVDLALADEGGAISAFEADQRARVLRRLRAAASDALCAAVSYPRPPQTQVG